MALDFPKDIDTFFEENEFAERVVHNGTFGQREVLVIIDPEFLSINQETGFAETAPPEFLIKTVDVDILKIVPTDIFKKADEEYEIIDSITDDGFGISIAKVKLL